MSHGLVFNLISERKTEVGLVKEWQKTVFVQEQDVPNFVKRFNMRTRGGSLFICEFVQKNQRRPRFAEPWSEASPTAPLPKIKRTRRTQAQMAAMREEALKRITSQPDKPKRSRRTKAQMVAARAVMN